jgi:hypothetical protein
VALLIPVEQRTRPDIWRSIEKSMGLTSSEVVQSLPEYCSGLAIN